MKTRRLPAVLLIGATAHRQVDDLGVTVGRAQAQPEVVIGAQGDVIGGKALGVFGGEAFARIEARRPTPVGGVGIEALIDAAAPARGLQ